MIRGLPGKKKKKTKKKNIPGGKRFNKNCQVAGCTRKKCQIWTNLSSPGTFHVFMLPATEPARVRLVKTSTYQLRGDLGLEPNRLAWHRYFSHQSTSDHSEHVTATSTTSNDLKIRMGEWNLVGINVRILLRLQAGFSIFRCSCPFVESGERCHRLFSSSPAPRTPQACGEELRFPRAVPQLRSSCACARLHNEKNEWN